MQDLHHLVDQVVLVRSLGLQALAVAHVSHGRLSSSSLPSASSTAPVMGASPPHRFALHRRRRRSWAPLLLIASLCIVDGAGHGRRSSSSLRSASSTPRVLW